MQIQWIFDGAAATARYHRDGPAAASHRRRGWTMPGEDEGSVTVWLGDLKAGGDEAVQPLWERYFERLVILARQRLRDAPRAVADEEDAALSAFDSFCRSVQGGRFPRLGDRDDLWRILVVI